MSAPHRYEVKVGLLVLAGMLSIFGMILAADKVQIERRWRLTAYLKDAAGLRQDSPVTLSGIAVGKVIKVEALPVAEIAAAPGAIRATLELPLGVDLPDDVQAKLSSSGLFGDAFLALAAAPAPNGQLMPKDGSGRLVVGPGFLDKAATRAEGLLAAADDLLAPEMRADAKRLVKSSADLAEHAAAVAARLDAQGARIEAILVNLEKTSADLATTSGAVAARIAPLADRADRLLAAAEKDGGAALERAASATARLDAVATKADALLAATGPAITTLANDLAATAASVRTVMNAVQTGQGLVGQLLLNRDLARDVHRIAIDATSAARTVADQPSRVVFDAPAAEREADRAQRDRELMRRALAEGFPAADAPLPPEPPEHRHEPLRPGEKPSDRRP